MPRIYINGGKRGFIIDLRTADLLRVLDPRLVSIVQ
jgi:prolyl-tRNA editing enzyme YbaK/EbsC (Cys-tRNA(Pro) deacylase)